MKKHLVVLIIIIVSFFFAGQFSAQNAAVNPEKEAIKRVVVDAYINGFFNKGDASLIKKGIHPDCDVLVLNKGSLMKIHAYSYVDRFEKNPGPLHPGTTYKFTDVHVTGYAGLAIVEIFREEKHVYTDYISLYKFEDGWKLVTKIFYRHLQN
ncbi:MAG: nuclear transport factor 2 family protein [Candidatus Aminicenantes bacterium]|nr:MAG: nuclear transport factor 2 family protein [Candidatus Aminicenantes bacterium]